MIINDFLWNSLVNLKIIEVVSNQGRNPKLGRGFSKAYRLNPYNPLSYIFTILMFFIGLLLFGIVGVWKEIICKNPFKWD